MQKVLFIGCMVCLLMLAGDATAQWHYPYKKDPALGIHFSLYDFNSATALREGGVNQLFKTGSLSNIGDMQPGLSISFLTGLTNHLDYQIRYTGCFVDYPFPNTPGLGEQFLLSSLDATLQLKLLSDKHWVTPFICGGVGVFGFKGSFGGYMPLGVGLQVNFFDEAFLLIHLLYQVGISETTAPSFYYSLGFAGNIGTSKKK
jgi:OmpA-OmpF porin, OOP family